MFAITYVTTVNGRRSTGTFELDLDQMTRPAIASAILGGEYDDLDEVFEFDPDEGTCSNVTEDMAKIVAALAAQEYRSLSYTLKSWLQEKGGLSLYHVGEAV